MIEIAAGNWRAGIRPDAGGALAFLTRADNDVLRPMPGDAMTAAAAACYPLVPWTGPIRLGRFTFGKRQVKLSPNCPPSRHSLNGLGWQRPWLLAGLVGASAELVFDHGGGPGWPWPFRASQLFELDEGGLSITLTLTNEGDEPMPGGLGLNPCFRRWRDSRACFHARKVVLSDIELIPTGEFAPADHFGNWEKGIAIPAATVDNSFRDWSGLVTISDGLGTITMTATGATTLHVFAPGTGRELHFAPANHLPDAFNRPDWPLPVIALGESATLAIRIEER